MRRLVRAMIDRKYARLVSKELKIILDKDKKEID